MKTKRTRRNLPMRISIACAATAVCAIGWAARQERQDPPRAVEPGEGGAPPSDAIALFDGSGLAHWTHRRERDPEWTIEEGALQSEPGEGHLFTRETFGDAQIHLEFMTPDMPDAEGQDRGNGGVYVQGRYEVQILDSYRSETYPDGQCGAIYGNHAPMVNASRPPGVWQTYDIFFRAARFSAAGEMTEPARFSVLHNGVWIHEGAEVSEPTVAAMRPAGPEPGPLVLQDHGNRVKFRNIWIRPLDPAR